MRSKAHMVCMKASSISCVPGSRVTTLALNFARQLHSAALSESRSWLDPEPDAMPDPPDCTDAPLLSVRAVCVTCSCHWAGSCGCGCCCCACGICCAEDDEDDDVACPYPGPCPACYRPFSHCCWSATAYC